MEVGTAVVTRSITPLTQATSKICWATCYAMMLAFKRKVHTEQDVKKLFEPMKTDADFRAHLEQWKADHPADNVDVDAEMDIWAYGYANGLMKEQMKFSAKAVGLVSVPSANLSDEDKFAAALGNGPLWCAGYFISTSGYHAVLATGIQKTEFGTNVFITDPYGLWNPQQLSATYQLSLTDFKKKLLKEAYTVQAWP